MIILLIRMAEIGMIPLIILSILIPGTAITNSNNDNILNAEAKKTSSLDNILGNNLNENILLNQKSTPSKVVILTFGDIHKSQFTTAKPILDQYGFKGSFFVPCEMVGKDSRMDWNDIEILYNEGHDIQAKSDKNLIDLSPDNLDSEVSQPKKCLSEHGIDPAAITTFAVRHGNAVLNSTVINTVAKYYDMAINGFSNLMRLNCTGYEDQPQPQTVEGGGRLAALVVSPNHQTDCRTYFDDGSITNANRYSIREWNHNAKDRKYDYNSTAIFNDFIQVVNSQSRYNNNTGGIINAIPLVAYHNIDNNMARSSTNIGLFATEMKYLHDNGFKVITMEDLGYDEMSNHLYIKKNRLLVIINDSLRANL